MIASEKSSLNKVHNLFPEYARKSNNIRCHKSEVLTKGGHVFPESARKRKPREEYSGAVGSVCVAFFLPFYFVYLNTDHEALS